MYRQNPPLVRVNGGPIPVRRRVRVRKPPASVERLPLGARALLGLLGLIERAILEYCPVRSWRRAGLARVDRAHARIRMWLDHGGAR